MTPEQEEKLKAMNLTPRVQELTRAIVDALTEEQRDKQGEFADPEKVNASAAARLRYLDGEGFLEANRP